MTSLLSRFALFSFLTAGVLVAEDKEPKPVDFPKGPGNEWLVMEPGADAAKKGKHILLVSGDDEYRSEEVLPQLGKLLAEKHGFQCTVTFSIDPKTGNVDPGNHTNLPGLAAMDQADLIIMLWRFREPKDEDMKRFESYLKAGKPIIALRTSTHAFAFDANPDSPYAKYDWQSKKPGFVGGFGKTILGETWVDHWGHHAVQGTKAIPAPSDKTSLITKGVGEITGDTDVYEAHPPADATILYRGQVLSTLAPDSPPATGPRKNQEINNPMMPIIWTRDFKNEFGTTNKVLVSTIGSATDFKNKALRHLMINAVHHLLGLPVPENPNTDFTPDYAPTKYGFGSFKKNQKPKDFLAAPAK